MHGQNVHNPLHIPAAVDTAFEKTNKPFPRGQHSHCNLVVVLCEKNGIRQRNRTQIETFKMEYIYIFMCAAYACILLEGIHWWNSLFNCLLAKCSENLERNFCRIACAESPGQRNVMCLYTLVYAPYTHTHTHILESRMPYVYNQHTQSDTRRRRTNK